MMHIFSFCDLKALIKMSKALNFLKKMSFITLSFILILSCSYKPPVRFNGVLNLDKRTKLILIGTSNKNDVIKLLGETLLKEQPNQNKWAYIETVEKKILGKRKIIKNTMLILEFNNKGILKTKKTLNKDNFNKVKFDQTQNESLGVNNSFSKRIFSSIRKRAQNKIGTIGK